MNRLHRHCIPAILLTLAATSSSGVELHAGGESVRLKDWIAFFNHPARGPLVILETLSGNCCGTNSTAPAAAAPVEVVIDGKKQDWVTPVVLTERVIHLHSPVPTGLECQSESGPGPAATSGMSMSVGGSTWPLAGDIEWRLDNGATRLVLNTVAGDVVCSDSSDDDDVAPGQDFGSIFDPGRDDGG